MEEDPERLSERLGEILDRGDDGRKMLYIDRFTDEILNLPEPDMEGWGMDDGEGPDLDSIWWMDGEMEMDVMSYALTGYQMDSQPI